MILYVFIDERPLVVGSMSVNCSLANDSILIIITLHNPIRRDYLLLGLYYYYQLGKEGVGCLREEEVKERQISDTKLYVLALNATFTIMIFALSSQAFILKCQSREAR